MDLKIQDLTCSLQKKVILKDIDLTIESKKITALLGPSGCGKTTLLKCIAGILPIDKGAIILGERDITAVPTHKRGAVVVFQDMRLFPHMTAAENVAFPLKMQGIGKKERLERAEEILKLVQLEGLGERKSDQLSGGQMQRVALARALAAEPEVLLLDEPFSSLDENLREDMRRLIRGIHEALEMTTVLVTHDRKEALSMSDTIAVIFDGEIEQVADPKTVYERPASEKIADYFGGGAYLTGSLTDNVFETEDFSLPLNRDLPNGNYKLFLREDALTFDNDGTLPLTVRAVHYQGGSYRIDLAGPGTFALSIDADDTTSLRDGDTLQATVIPERVIVFPH